MPNPNENNTPVQNKEKANKEFAQENETPQKENINLESNYKSKDTKPVSINIERANESRAIGNNTPKSSSEGGSLSENPKVTNSNDSGSSFGSGSLSENPKVTNSNDSGSSFGSGSLSENPKVTNSNDSGSSFGSGSLGGIPKEYIPKVPEGTFPKVDDAPPVSESKSTPETVGTVGSFSKEKKPSGNEVKSGSLSEAPKEKEKILVSGALKEVFGVVQGEPKEDPKKVSTESVDEEGSKQIKEAKDSIELEQNMNNNVTSTNENLSGDTGGGQGGETTGNLNGEVAQTPKDAKAKEEAEALGAFEVKETKDELRVDAENNAIKTEGKNHGLIVGRSMGYGAKLTSSSAEDKPFSISKFSENDNPEEEEAAKNKYNKENDVIAKNMELFGSETSTEGEGGTGPKKGYYDAYIEGYNEGHREGTALKKEAAVAERTAQMEKEQGTEEYIAGMSLGMTCGILKAKGEKEVDTTFSMTKDGEKKTIAVKTTVAELDSAAFDKKQTPGGELSGPAYEKAFLIHYNIGYRQAQNQRSQPPPMDEDYKLGYKQGYKLGSQKGNGEKGDEDLLKVEATNDAKDEKELKKEELQQYRGFYVGYNKGYTQVQEAKKNKGKKEREEKYKKPNFVAGYSTGNLKGFLTAMVEPSGIDLLAALNDPKKMEAAGIPSFFPIPEALKKNIKATLVHGDVADNKKESDSTKALLGKPLFKEGLLMGYNQGYLQGQKSRGKFKRDKHKMHPDYQRSTMVLMAGDDSGYTGPTESGASVTGFTMGQILANANFELYELTAKKGRSEKEEKRFEDLTKAVASINGIIAKENNYYKLGVDEFYNWWMGELAKRAQKKKSDEGYAGMKPSVKREGFDWGFKVGEKTIEAKNKIKEIKRKGHDIKSRSADLNKTIKKTDTKAKGTSKDRGGEDYYIGYRNGYNHAFRVAKEGKKSDKGNLDAGDLLENAGNVNSQHINEIYLVVTKDISLGVSMGEPKFGEAIQSAKEKFKKETEKAFEDGLSIGYNSGYDAEVVDIKTGKPKGGAKTNETKITDKFNEYKKLKDDDKAKYTESIALGVLYFFLIGYQFHNKEELETKYGLPKGISDAKSFNVGFDTGMEESKNGKIVDNSSKANSKDAYKAGYNAAKSRAQYEKFKKGMISSVLSSTAKEEKKTGEPKNKKSEEEPKNGSEKRSDSLRTTPGNSKNGETEMASSTQEGSVDESLTGGLALLADEKTKDEAEKKKHAKEDGSAIDDHYNKGSEDATMLWTKIIYLKEGVKLEGATIPDELQFKDGDTPVTLTNDVTKAAEYYARKDALIEQFASDYMNPSTNPVIKMLMYVWSFLAGEAKQSYIDGYKAKIKSIESNCRVKSIEDWLYNAGYYDAVKEMAPDTDFAKPSQPYTDMSDDERNYSSPNYKSGYLEGLKMGNLVKNGIVKPAASDLVAKSGSDATRGFEEGKKAGQKEGLLDAKKTDEKLPSEEEREDKIQKRLDEEYKAKHNGENDGMNEDYKDAYIEAYFSTYWEARDYEYGRLLGYDRGAKGGDDVYNVEPEEGVIIKNENAFFRGFDAGREIGVLGLSKDALYKDDEEGVSPTSPMSVIQKITSEYAARNAAIDAIHELKLKERIIRKIVYTKDPFYKRYAKLGSIKSLGIEDQSAGSLGELLQYYEVEDQTVISKYLEEGFKEHLETSFMKCSSEERTSYSNAFKTSYEEAYKLAHMQSLSELIPVSMTAQFDQRKDVSVMGGGMDSGFNETEDSALDVLKDLLFGGTQDFHLDELLLLDMFYALETKIEEVQYYIKDDLEEIEFNRSLAGLYSEDDQKDYEDLAKLEAELEEGNLTKRQKTTNRKKIKKLKALIASKDADTQETYKNWEAAEAAAKEKIDSIRILMRDSLAFDTPLESNEDILAYIKINLESSKGNDEDIYEDIDIFNDLFLTGSFDYKESRTIDASILGDAYFSLDHYAENVYIDNADVLMKENGFEFKSMGMSYIKHDTVNFMSGSIVTPSIEGGAHMGEQYVYNFNDFSIHLGQGIKAQIDAQKHKLEGGPK